MKDVFVPKIRILEDTRKSERYTRIDRIFREKCITDGLCEMKNLNPSIPPTLTTVCPAHANLAVVVAWEGKDCGELSRLGCADGPR